MVSVLLLLRLLRLLLGLLGSLSLRRKTAGGHLVQKVGKVRRAEEHACQVVQPAVLLIEGTVLETQLVSLVGAGSDLAL